MAWTVQIWKNEQTYIEIIISIRMLAKFLKEKYPNRKCAMPPLPFLIAYSIELNGNRNFERIKITRG